MLVLQIPGTSVHWYGKEVQNKRKLGHITITGADNQEAHQRLHSIDSVAADAMAAASDRYTEATSRAQTQGWSSCALKSAVIAVHLHVYLCMHLLAAFAVFGCLSMFVVVVSFCAMYWFTIFYYVSLVYFHF